MAQPGPDAWRWRVDDLKSDLEGTIGDETLRLISIVEGPTTTIGFNVPFNGSYSIVTHSPRNEPCRSNWGVGGDTANGRIRVLTGHAGVEYQPSLQRISADGTFKQGYMFSVFPTPVVTPGIKNWSGQTTDQTKPQGTAPYFPPVASDRIQHGLLFTRDDTIGSGLIEIEVGTSDQFLRIPLDMGLSKIVFDGTTLSLPKSLSRWKYQRRANRNLVISQGGVPTTSVRHLFDEVEATWENLTDAAFEESLRAFFAWASTGNPFSFTRDVNDGQITTLDSSASAGQKVIPVTSEAGFVSGNSYLIRQAKGDREEMIVIAATAAGSITTVANLKFSYLTGDTLKSRFHFPKLVLLDPDDPVTEGLTWYDFALSAREDLS